MDIKELQPRQVITSSHRNLHDLHVLKIYFRIFQKGCRDITPPSPVMHRDIMSRGFDGELKSVFEDFIQKHPEAEYFLLDGSHKTTAAVLTENPCSVMVIRTQEDIDQAKEMEKSGEIFQYLLGDTIREIIDDISGHFREKRFFWTVDEKTQFLVDNNLLPPYMQKK